jgi:hypothetical protein
MAKRKKTGNKAKPAAKPRKKSKKGYWNMLLISSAFALIIGVMVWAPTMRNAGATEVTVYKSPTCGCCSKWIDHLRDEGFYVIDKNRNNVNQIKLEHGVQHKHASCHTALVEGYVVEGHVPANDIKRMLHEKPKITGLAVPGMPMGSPGMEGNYKDPYEVLAFVKGGKTKIFSRH